MKPMPFAYKNGSVVPIEETKVSMASHSLQYGSICYTGMRGAVRNGAVRLFRLRDHYLRLVDSAKILGWDCDLTYEQFSGALRELIEKNEPETDFYIRAFLLADIDELEFDYSVLRFSLAIYLVPLGALFDASKGLKLKISSWKRVSDDAIPLKAKAGGCYLNSCLAHTDARREGYDDALMMNQAGHLAEPTGANAIVVYKGRVLTPAPGAGLLDGITLRSCVEILESEGIRVEEAPIDRSMIYAADEIAMIGTAVQIQFTESVDGRRISKEGAGIVSSLLQKRMKAILERKDKRFDHWITEWPLKKQEHELEKIACAMG